MHPDADGRLFLRLAQRVHIRQGGLHGDRCRYRPRAIFEGGQAAVADRLDHATAVLLHQAADHAVALMHEQESGHISVLFEVSG
jgi:hypothetical protein